MVSKQKLVGLGLEFWCLTPLSTIFQLYSGSQKLTICLGDYMLFFRKYTWEIICYSSENMLGRLYAILQKGFAWVIGVYFPL